MKENKCGWKTSTVGKAMNIKNNLREPISESERSKIQGEYPYYGPTKIQDYINKYNLDGKYVLIGEDGDHFLKYKYQSMTLLVDGKFNVNNHAHILKGTNECMTEWFYYYFQHKNIYNALTRQGAGRYKLTKASLEKLIIEYPSLDEQKKITTIISEWDLAINKLEFIIEKKHVLKKGLLQRILGKDVITKEFRDSLITIKLKDIGKIIRGVSYKPSDLQERENEGNITLLRSNNIFNNKIVYDDIQLVNFNKVKKEQILQTYDIVICMANGSKRLVGKNGMFIDANTNRRFTVGAFCAIFRCNNNIDKSFMKYIFESSQYSLYVQNLFAGSNINNLKGLDLEGMEFLIPESIATQKKIADILILVDKEIELLEKELEVLKLQKKGLMQRLLTGEVRVKI